MLASVNRTSAFQEKKGGGLEKKSFLKQGILSIELLPFHVLFFYFLNEINVSVATWVIAKNFLPVHEYILLEI